MNNALLPARVSKLVLIATLVSAFQPSLISISFANDIPSADIGSFARRYCADCHLDGSAEGGLDLSKLSRDLSDEAMLAKWIRIFDRVIAREMPPQDAEPVTSQHLQAFTTLLGSQLTRAHAANKGTVLRRLNRREYENTLNDMFGTNLELAAMLPEDGRSHEFDNIGNALSVSLVQMQRYIDAAQQVLDASIAKTVAKPESSVIRASYADTRGAEKWLGSQWLKRADGAVVFFKESGYPTGMLREANVRNAGFYKVRVTGYAHQTDEPVTFSIGATTFARGAERPIFGYYSMPPLHVNNGKPTTVEIETWIESRYMIQVEPYGLTDRYEIKRNGIDNYRGPGLAILHVEVEGPVVREFPSRGHSMLFRHLTRTEIQPANPRDKSKPWYKPKFALTADDLRQDLQATLEDIAAAAFRRPATSAQVEAYVTLLNSEIDNGSPLEDALRTAVTAILCSPDFLFFREPSGKLDDYAVASRLSYFLTRTLPDKQLLDAARRGQLTGESSELRKHTERLLQHPHHERFVADYTDAWLDLRNIDFTTPDRILFPEFEPFLQFSIVEESRAFLAELINANLPITNIVRSDFAMLNNRLAEHYGIDDVVGPEIRRVDLPTNSVRGGILSQAAVMKVSANGTNTSPVVRGVWVMERILGQTPPPPPAGVPGVEPDTRGAETLRELLEKHRNIETCNSCHRMIDPPGFALECFNPIGGWRDRYRSTGEGERIALEVRGNKVRYKLAADVDASGQLSDGQAFTDYQQFRDLLAKQDALLAKAFVTKLLTFAAGREMGFSDRAEIDRIVHESAADGYRVRDLIHLVVQSDIFQSK